MLMVTVLYTAARKISIQGVENRALETHEDIFRAKI